MICCIVYLQGVLRSKCLFTNLTLVAETVREVDGLHVVSDFGPLGPGLATDGAVVSPGLWLVGHELIQILRGSRGFWEGDPG